MITYNQPFEVTARQYRAVMNNLRGYCAGRHDATTNKYYLKPFIFSKTDKQAIMYELVKN